MAGGSLHIKTVPNDIVVKICTTSTILKAFVLSSLSSLSTSLFSGKATYSSVPQVPEMGYCNLACVHKFGRGVRQLMLFWGSGKDNREVSISAVALHGQGPTCGTQGTAGEVEP